MKNRRSLRLQNYDYSQSGAYFITICTHNRKLLFGEIESGEMVLNAFGKIAQEEWLRTQILRTNIIIDEFVVMPNHIHGIIIISRRGTMHRAPPTEQLGKPTHNTIPTIIRGYKSSVTKQINQLRDTPRQQIWQRNYYEHIIRNKTDLSRIQKYITNNPMNWHLDKENPTHIRRSAQTASTEKQL